MARPARNYELNGAAAYDIYARAYQDTGARELELPRELPEERPLPKKKTRVKAKTAVAPFTLLGMLAVSCLMILVIFGYVQLYEASSQVSSLESKLQDLNEQQVLLNSKYEGKINLADIEEKAGTLGLHMPTTEQIVYVNLSGADQAVIYTEEKTSIVQEIVSAVEESIANLIAYLRPASA